MFILLVFEVKIILFLSDGICLEYVHTKGFLLTKQENYKIRRN